MQMMTNKSYERFKESISLTCHKEKEMTTLKKTYIHLNNNLIETLK